MDKESYLNIVNHIKSRLERYPEGGTRDEKWKFFSDLDNSYQTEDIVDPILESIYVPNLILTGSFGAYVTTRLADLHLDKDYILFNGHIREGEAPEILAEHHCGRNIESSPYIQTWMLFDDSNYSGRTRFVLENWMLQNRSHPITSTVVIYNGAPNFHPQVNALYSWYMVNSFLESRMAIIESGQFKVRKNKKGVWIFSYKGKSTKIASIGIGANITGDAILISCKDGSIKLGLEEELKEGDKILQHFKSDILAIFFEKPLPAPFNAYAVYMDISEKMLPMVKALKGGNDSAFHGDQFDAFARFDYILEFKLNISKRYIAFLMIVTTIVIFFFSMWLGIVFKQ